MTPFKVVVHLSDVARSSGEKVVGVFSWDGITKLATRASAGDVERGAFAALGATAVIGAVATAVALGAGAVGRAHRPIPVVSAAPAAVHAAAAPPVVVVSGPMDEVGGPHRTFVGAADATLPSFFVAASKPPSTQRGGGSATAAPSDDVPGGGSTTTTTAPPSGGPVPELPPVPALPPPPG